MDHSVLGRAAVLAVLATAFLAADHGSAGAGVIRGRLALSAGRLTFSSRNGGPDHSRPQPGVTDAVIYVERIPEKTERKLTGHGWFFTRRAEVPRMIQADLQFVPRVMSIAAGTMVEFLNLDRVYHNPFSVSAAKRFDLGKNAPGRTDTVRFERTGVVNLHCEIHPEMTGYVVVVPNHAFTRPDSLGGFALPKLPDGDYVVHAWHPRHGDITQHVTLDRHGDAELELAFKP
jgi:hypothetical protein